MIGTSTFEYGLIRTSIFAIRAVTPLSVAYCVLRPFLSPFIPFYASDVWPLAECLFFFVAYLPLKERCQRQAIHPPLLSMKDRGDLFSKCVRNTPDPDAYLSRWFMDAPLAEIKQENVKEFLSWAFLNSSTRRASDEAELEKYTKELEVAAGREIASGLGQAKCLRLTTDEVNMCHRPLVWYLIVFGADQVTHLWLLYCGFRYYRTSLGSSLSTIPFRPLTALSIRRSPVKTLSYWLRPHKSQTRLPVVLLHGESLTFTCHLYAIQTEFYIASRQLNFVLGIGIGLLTYVPFLAELNQFSEAQDDVGIIAIEILPISFRITHSTLEKRDMCRQINIILHHHVIEKFVLVAHSYGSVITTHLLKDEEVSVKIASVVLVDPVSILLHLPDVAYNFTYRKPRQANEWQLWYFASMDMGVAHTLRRGFFWADNILWKKDLAGKNCTVFLGGRDLIVGTRNLWSYLTRDDSWCQAVQNEAVTTTDIWESGSGLKVFWSEELDHAQIFDSIPRRRQLVDEVLNHTEELVD